MTVFDMAKKYYPTLWGKKRIDNLYKAKRITEEEYKFIINMSKDN